MSLSLTGLSRTKEEIRSLLPFPDHFTASEGERDIGEERKEEEVHLTADVVREHGSRCAKKVKIPGRVSQRHDSPIIR